MSEKLYVTTRLSPKSGTAGEIAKPETTGRSFTGLTVRLNSIELLVPPFPSLTLVETNSVPLKFG